MKINKKIVLIICCALISLTGLLSLASCLKKNNQRKHNLGVEAIADDTVNEYFCLAQEDLSILCSYLTGIDKLGSIKTTMSTYEIKTISFAAHYFLKTHFEEHINSLNKISATCNEENSETITKLTGVLKKLVNIYEKLNNATEENNWDKVQRYIAERNEENSRLLGELESSIILATCNRLSSNQKETLYNRAKDLFPLDNKNLIPLYKKHHYSCLDIILKENITTAQYYLIWLGKEDN